MAAYNVDKVGEIEGDSDGELLAIFDGADDGCCDTGVFVGLDVRRTGVTGGSRTGGFVGGLVTLELGIDDFRVEGFKDGNGADLVGKEVLDSTCFVQQLQVTRQTSLAVSSEVDDSMHIP